MIALLNLSDSLPQGRPIWRETLPHLKDWARKIVLVGITSLKCLRKLWVLIKESKILIADRFTKTLKSIQKVFISWLRVAEFILLLKESMWMKSILVTPMSLLLMVESRLLDTITKYLSSESELHLECQNISNRLIPIIKPIQVRINCDQSLIKSNNLHLREIHTVSSIAFPSSLY